MTPTYEASPFEFQEQQRSSITFQWFLHLRWGAILSQVILICMTTFVFEMEVPLVLVCTILFFEIISNCLFYALKKQRNGLPDWLFAVIMFVDVLLFTVLLAQTGGAMNPFSFLYLLHIVIGAIALPAGLAWALCLLTILCYGSFFFDLGTTNSQPGVIQGAVVKNTTCEMPVSTNASNQIDLHLQGMLVAFTVTAISIIFFIGRLRTALNGYTETLELLRAEKIKTDKLGSLATLAAGAAHEFSTPLATIAVAAGEMLYTCREHNLSQDIIEDALLIKNQVATCKDILDQLGADAGSQRGEPNSSFSIKELFEIISEDISLKSNQKINFSMENRDQPITAPRRTLARIIKGLIKNGFDASDSLSMQQVSVAYESDPQWHIFRVTDKGAGMKAEILHRANEPFFTSKEPGKGMGLGLFLAQSFVDQQKGTLAIQSIEQHGTTVLLRLPNNM